MNKDQRNREAVSVKYSLFQPSFLLKRWLLMLFCYELTSCAVQSIFFVWHIDRPSNLLAWSSGSNDGVNILNLKTKKQYAQYEGAHLSARKDQGKFYKKTSLNKQLLLKDPGNRAHLKEIPGSNLLVAIRHLSTLRYLISQKKGGSEKYCLLKNFLKVTISDCYSSIFSFRFFLIASIIIHSEDCYQRCEDVAYNSRRGIIGAISIKGKAAYHLFNVSYDMNKNMHSKFLKKIKWHSENNIDKCMIICSIPVIKN